MNAYLHPVVQKGLETFDRLATDGPVATLLGKIDGGVDPWLTFVGEPALSLTNNVAENEIRESVVLRKILGTL